MINEAQVGTLQASASAVGIRWLTVHWLLTVLILAFSFEFCSFSLAADSPRPKEVLVLYGFSDLRLNDYAHVDSLKAMVRSQVQASVNFQVEPLESQRLDDPAYEQTLSKALAYYYAGKKMDVIVVYSFPALRFALVHRKDIFPGVPIIFSDVYLGRIESQKFPPEVTGVTLTGDVRGSVELAFRLHPETKNVALVSGATQFEQYWLKVFHEEFPFRDKANLIDLVGLPPDQLMTQVLQLPPRTLVFIQMLPQASVQPAIDVFDAMAMISQRFPLYCIYADYCVGRGGVGGSFPDYTAINAKTANLVARVVSGEKAEKIPVVHDSGGRPVVDWRQLRHWNIPESALPAGSIVLYREPNLWDRYRKFVLGGIAILILQTLLILGLLKQRANRRAVEESLVASNTELKRSEAVLRESEERFRRVADTTPVLIWMSGPDKLFTFVNQCWLTFTGRSMEEELAEGWVASVYPEDVSQCLQIYSASFDARADFEMEYRLRRRDGEYRWLVGYGVPRFESNGTFCGYIGSCVDITERKSATESLQALSGRLIHAQDEERARIARDLHDDFSQSLALQCIDLEQLLKKVAKTETDERTRLLQMLKRTKQMSADMRALSHQLHSNKLEYVGLVTAVSRLCEEISAQYEIEVRFTECRFPQNIPKDVTLCLFRVTQEALGNVVKHSQAKTAKVELGADSSGVSLRITDEGKGFEPNDANRGGGLGLVGMTERLRLVGGRLLVKSKLMQGTTLLAEVPMSAFPTEGQVRTMAAGGTES
jgi:PAS domain S-box-containing protein